MNKKFVKNLIVITASIVSCSCNIQTLPNSQTPKNKGIGKIIYSSSYIGEPNYPGSAANYYTNTYIYDANLNILIKEINMKLRETFYKWSIDGNKIMSYRSNDKNSIVIHDSNLNEIDKIETPVPESESVWLNNSNKIIFASNNSVPNNPNLELSIYNYDLFSKTSKKITGSEPLNLKKFWPELSFDDNFLFITEQSSEQNKESDTIKIKSSIYTLNINNGQKNLITEFDGDNSLINRLKWNPIDKSKFLALINDGDIYFIDVKSKEKTLISSKDKRKVFEIKFSPNSNEVFLYSTDKTILFNLDTKEEKEYSERLTFSCDKEIFLLNESDSIYKTDRKISKKELIFSSKTDLFGRGTLNISDINCSQN